MVPGAFVRVYFPTREKPRKPGLLHIGYILVSSPVEAMVAYTTSQPWPTETPLSAGVRLFTAVEAKRLNQSRPFVLPLDVLAKLPMNPQWFPKIEKDGQGVIAIALILGPRRKYSCCLYPDAGTNLIAAEDYALAETADHAELADGQRILELGCGWGSLSLWMAEKYPRAQITSVSNSASQRSYITEQAQARGLANLRVITADMNDFNIDQRFDRVVSVEMFEHMANWRGLLARVRNWLTPGGKLFLHVFTHETTPYRFDHKDQTDWIAQHFFTGGLMPSHQLIREFPDLFHCEKSWRWSGDHYRRTAFDWLRNFDRNRASIDVILADVYGKDAALWRRRWRLFFLATAGLFGHDDGADWGVSHYLLW